GRFSSAKAFDALSGLRAMADARGAVLVYPEPAGGFWNDGGHAPLQRGGQPPDDIAFLHALIDAVGRTRAIDRHRVFLVGEDNGGLFAYRVACEGALELAGVAIVSATMWDFQETACRAAPAHPTSLLILQGRRDAISAIDGDPPAATPRRIGLART